MCTTTDPSWTRRAKNCRMRKPRGARASRASMENLLPVIGYVGTGIVIGAYVPQIWHLWCEQCSAGISERAYALWVLSSALFLGHSIIIDDMVFMVTQLVNVIALVVILMLRAAIPKPDLRHACAPASRT